MVWFAVGVFGFQAVLFSAECVHGLFSLFLYSLPEYSCFLWPKMYVQSFSPLFFFFFFFGGGGGGLLSVLRQQTVGFVLYSVSGTEVYFLCS